MKHTLNFIKASGAGNDFIVLDAVSQALPPNLVALARALCSRSFGVGADGLLVLEPSDQADFAMRYFNTDGSFGGMCGNGGRCAAMVAYRLGWTGPKLVFRALDYDYAAEVNEGLVSLHMRDVTGTRRIPPSGLGKLVKTESMYVDTGAPHVVLFTEDIEGIDVMVLGRQIRYHSAFAPGGTNVDFVQVMNKSAIVLRTYERGVEGETLACGTGSVASAIASVVELDCLEPVDVRVRSGERLRVSFQRREDIFTNIVLEGSAHILFRGNVLYDDISGTIAVDGMSA